MDLYAGPLVLKVTLCRLRPEAKVTPPASFKIKDFLRSMLVALL